jgi:VWFA-related protein
MRFRALIILTVLALATTPAIRGQQQQTPPPAAPTQRSGSTFRSAVNLILVDVDVRDKNGQPIKGLKESDFEILEDGKPQEIRSFAFEEITAKAAALTTASMLSTAGNEKGAVSVTVGPTKPGAAPAAKPADKPADAPDKTEDKPAAVDAANGALTSDEIAGHRVWVLLFDTSSMQPEDVQKAADSAVKWAKEKMSPADLVAVASIGSTLQILLDFTTDQTKVLTALQAFSAAEGTAAAATDVDASTMASDEASNNATTADTTVDTSAQELDTFNNDVRLRGLKTVCDNLLSFQQKKAVLYFSSGMQRNGSDNQVELRAATNSCVRANVTLNPVDSRGLQAVVPGGSARQSGRGGVGAFSGRNVANQFSQLASQQETLQTLASDTGGTAFTDSNDFGEAFDKVQKDISSYYILGYASTNPGQDGKYRKIDVKLKAKVDARVRAREGYYAERDFTHTAKGDRETQLQDQLMMAIPATDVPLFVTAGYFRLPATTTCPGGGPGPGGRGGYGGGRGGFGPGGPGGQSQEPSACYYVPISLAVPGEAVPPSKDAVTLDVRGYVRDERGQPFATIKDTLTVPPASKDALSTKQVLYQTGTTLPPGHYRAKIVVRENTSGQMGTFELEISVPDLRRQSVKVSSVVLSTQLQSAVGRKTVSPLVRDNVEIVPNLTHVVSQDQKLYFYYEVYDPNTPQGAHPQIRTSLAFYRGKVKVFETPVVERTALDVADRKATVFQFEVPASDLKPGLYTCQVNIVDEVASAFTFPRLELFVRPTEKGGAK